MDFPLDINKGYVQRCTMSLLHFYVENMACSKVDSWLLPEITSCQKEEEEEEKEEKKEEEKEDEKEGKKEEMEEEEEEQRWK